MVIKKEIIYPIFLECCQYATDIFWGNIFEDLAYGKTPYGTYINKNFLCCSYKNKEFSYKIERKNSDELYNDVYNLLTNKLGILSHKEKLKKRVDFHKTEDRIKECRQEWCNIRKKNIKDMLVERYVVDMKNKHNLTLKQAKYLLSVLFVSIVFKIITPEDIQYSDNKIQNIDGIEFDNKKIIIHKTINDIQVDFIDENKDNSKTMSENWEKFLNLLRKTKTN
jgi:hypothetical protein